MVDLQSLLEKARRCTEQAEVFAIEQRDEPVIFEANALKEIGHREMQGVALRVVKGGRIGFSSTTDVDDGDGLLARAVEMTQFGAVANFELPPRLSFPSVSVHDPEVENINVETMINIGQALIDKVRQVHRDVQWEARITRGIGKVHILNSRGGYVEYDQTGFGVFLEGTRIWGEDMLFVWDAASSCHPIYDVDGIISTVLRQLDQANIVSPTPLGQMPVLFTSHGVAGALLEPLVVGFNGRYIVEQTSPLTGKIGELLLDRHLTLTDDPLQSYVPGSRVCDDEGVPSRTIPMVHEGVIGNFLYDLQTGGRMGVESTGSAGRSLGSLPAPSPSVVMMSPGDVSLEEMIHDVKDGLLVEHLLGAGQGNLLGGDFSANVLLGYRIEKGRIVGRVKNAMIHGNVYAVLRDIPAISRDASWVGGSTYLPNLLCGRVTVSASQ